MKIITAFYTVALLVAMLAVVWEVRLIFWHH
jgi:hypothetical protein